MDFVLALHSHLPYVLNHGRWPHGSDWITEAALDTYLPLLEQLRGLADENVSAPVTIGFTPVLANQLRHPTFTAEMDQFFTQRLLACEAAPASLQSTGDASLLPLVEFWRQRLLRLQALWVAIDKDIIGAFTLLERRGRIEIIGSAATHGFLPLLARDESIRLQLALGFAEHRRIFGRDPVGCWLPECAYRPRGPWAPWPGAPAAGVRRGIEEHLADAGFRYFFVDAHLAAAGQPLNLYGGRLDEEPHVAAGQERPISRSPYQAYRVSHGGGSGDVAVYVRDPKASSQVWSRSEGYPGDEWYLEFHKMRWPGGLKLWRVSAPGSDLGAKAPYDPEHASQRAAEHGRHFAWLLGRIAAGGEVPRGGVVAAPFDTELYGHWWFEGPEFLAHLYRELDRTLAVRPVSGTRHLSDRGPGAAIRLPSGSWGANGDFSMWIGEQTAWTWERLWALEGRFWDVAPAALANPAAHLVLEQAAREMLLAQSSDWQFIISTGHVVDYAERRFRGHCDDAELLVDALAQGGAALESARQVAADLRERDDLFPSVLPAIAAAASGSRSLAVR
jgi:1,4-alpha-glucan branching enzyme